jgi:hypothetical protein
MQEKPNKMRSRVATIFEQSDAELDLACAPGLIMRMMIERQKAACQLFLSHISVNGHETILLSPPGLGANATTATVMSSTLSPLRRHCWSASLTSSCPHIAIVPFRKCLLTTSVAVSFDTASHRPSDAKIMALSSGNKQCVLISGVSDTPTL